MIESGNVLLAGPPGTGKSDLMRTLQQSLEEDADAAERSVTMQFDADSVTNPFRTGTPTENGEFPGTVRTAWVTFHESMSHSEFVLGLRPNPTGDGTSLRPRAGVLLELAEHARDGNTSVLFIDELNRANVSEVFGQFITVMELEKRLSADGTVGDSTVGLVLPQVNNGDTVQLPTGGDFEIELPYHFPKNLYVVASMNSLDRSTAPLDSALARRFEQIRVGPDYEAFAAHLSAGVDSRSLSLDGASPLNAISSDPAATEPEELALALLAQVNRFLESALGADFQLGPGYLWRVGEVSDQQEERVAALLTGWDGKVVPKLRELFRSRDDQLELLLRPDSISRADEAHPYRRPELTSRWEQQGLQPPLSMPPLRALPVEQAIRALHAIADQSGE